MTQSSAMIDRDEAIERLRNNGFHVREMSQGQGMTVSIEAPNAFIARWSFKAIDGRYDRDLIKNTIESTGGDWDAKKESQELRPDRI